MASEAAWSTRRASAWRRVFTTLFFGCRWRFGFIIFIGRRGQLFRSRSWAGRRAGPHHVQLSLSELCVVVPRGVTDFSP